VAPWGKILLYGTFTNSLNQSITLWYKVFLQQLTITWPRISLLFWKKKTRHFNKQRQFCPSNILGTDFRVYYLETFSSHPTQNIVRVRLNPANPNADLRIILICTFQKSRVKLRTELLFREHGTDPSDFKWTTYFVFNCPTFISASNDPVLELFYTSFKLTTYWLYHSLRFHSNTLLSSISVV
jgi:hypothetical protein